VSRFTYPGFLAAWGSTSQWVREPKGPFVAVTYTRPDGDGFSTREERFFSNPGAMKIHVEGHLGRERP
jgi:hypothetical protein